ncbi:MAG: MarR family winged helix-turn-helix transcriptional regulator [Oceanicola sp.]|nr:MarR family winged helix-turn-helix transcriptional regulator [Oceanicola sp.]
MTAPRNTPPPPAADLGKASAAASQSFDLAGFTAYRLAVAAQSLSEELARQYRDRFGISIPDWRVLVHVSTGGDISVRDIEARVAMEKSKASRAASRLVARGLLQKHVNDTDRRLVRLSLTPEGKALMDALLPVAETYQREIDARLGPLKEAFEAALDAVVAAPEKVPR